MLGGSGGCWEAQGECWEALGDAGRLKVNAGRLWGCRDAGRLGGS